MTTNLAQGLLNAVESTDAFDYDAKDLQQTQLEALDQSFQTARARVKALDRTAIQAGVERIDSFDSAIPLLFSHTTYKGYPESFLRKKQWSRLAEWLDLFSTDATSAAADFNGVETIDQWIARLSESGHYVIASSGTTGKCSLMNQNQDDLEQLARLRVHNMTWATGAVPDHSRPLYFPVPPQPSHQVQHIYRIYTEAFGRPGDIHWLTDSPLLLDDINRAGRLRESVKLGTALPSEIAEQTRSAARSRNAMSDAFVRLAMSLGKTAHEPAMICGTWAQHWHLAQALEEAGVDQLHPETVVVTGGGLKGLQVPTDYQDVISRQYGIPLDRFYRLYGATEINSHMVGCSGGRYHVPPWVIPLVLDKSGENLQPDTGTSVEGRMAFFDFAVRGRWGGVITGDKVTVHYGQCDCGMRSPSISSISRYADLEEGEGKLSCAGTMDAYVRGEFGA